jgi:hypothetical protein
MIKMMGKLRVRFFLCLGLLLLRFLYVAFQFSLTISGTSLQSSSSTEVFLRMSRAQFSKIDHSPVEVLSQIPVPHHHPSEKVTTSTTDESFSACLLVMDENFRLYEWIAYHYHVLPLRYLVLAVDPRSKHLPDPVLDLFRQQLNMTILSWNDTDYIPSDSPLRPKDEIERHRARQLRFMKQCLHHMHQHNRTWTALWDTDEFIGFNGYNVTRRKKSTKSSATSPNDMSEPGSILRYVKDIREDRSFGMNRLVVGNKELPSIMNETHPFDPLRFDTLRYRFRARPGDAINGFGKCMLNVKKIWSFPIRDGGTVHSPVLGLCPLSWGDHLLRSPFVIHHFMGSWEAYSYRDDIRRGRERTYATYVEKSQRSDEYENKLSQWMPAFIDSVGEERATILLEYAGLDPHYNATFKIESFQKV